MKTRDAVLLLIFCARLASAGTVEDRAARILIHSIDVEDTSPRAVFEFLKEQSKAADPEGKGLNMLFRFTPAGQKIFEQGTVTLKLTDVPLNAVVRYVCLASGLLYSYDENTLMVFDSKAAQPYMETRVYHMGVGVVDSPRTRTKVKPLDRNDNSSGNSKN